MPLAAGVCQVPFIQEETSELLGPHTGRPLQLQD